MIDLHSHTTASDGQHAPTQQLELAAKAGVTVLAVTDHDTLGGLAEATQAAGSLGVRLIPGIELSTWHNAREVHVLGHFIDPHDAQLASLADDSATDREGRMREMLRRLSAAGLTVDFEVVRAIAGSAPLTRPHLARALVELNHCRTVKEAFDRWLGDGKLAHVTKKELSVAQAISLIHAAGGTATLAHPGGTRINHLELVEFAAAGLDGLEVEHVDHPPSQREKLREWAHELKLECTAGSDFHGLAIAPNRLFGSVTMGATALAALEARRPRIAQGAEISALL